MWFLFGRNSTESLPLRRKSKRRRRRRRPTTMTVSNSQPRAALALFLVDPFPVLAVAVATAILEFCTSSATFKLGSVLLVSKTKTSMTHLSLFDIGLDKLSAACAIILGPRIVRLCNKARTLDSVVICFSPNQERDESPP